MIYTYDQLNRITSSTNSETKSARGTGKYGTQYQYDANGNIMHLKRNDENGSAITDIGYRYNYNTPNKLLTTNHLQNVSGSQGRVRNTDYEYDLIGNLTRSEELDEQNKTTIDFITWTVYGKIAQVHKKVTDSDGEHFMTVVYQYDGGGNRVLKSVERNDFTSVMHYVRDASGNILATYDNAELKEFNIYGSSRLGNYRPTKDDYGKLILGYRNYELTNHLGNVLAVISDKKMNDFSADVVSASDYYPFGMAIKSRSFDGNYRFSFQGQESDNELFDGESASYRYRNGDKRTGRFPSVDPLFRKYPHYSPFSFSGNKLIAFRELEGLEDQMNIAGQTSLTPVLQKVDNNNIFIYDYHTFDRITYTPKKQYDSGVVAINISHGTSLGAFYAGSSQGTHYGLAADTKGNVLFYGSTENFVDFSPWLKRLKLHPVFEGWDGNSETGESVLGGDLDVADGQVATSWNGTVKTYLNTTDFTVDLGPFSASLAYNDADRVLGYEWPDGAKISASVGWGWQASTSQTDVLGYIIYHHSEVNTLINSYLKLKNKTQDGEHANFVRYDFRLNKDTGLYRLHLINNVYKGYEGKNRVPKVIRTDSVDTGLDFTKEQTDSEANYRYGFNSIKMAE